MTPDVAIIGAGIVGAACAESLTARGLKVTIIESTGVGAGTTATGMGHIVVMDDSDAQMALTRYSRELWEDLIPAMPSTIEYEPAGTLWVAADDEELEGARKRLDYYRRWKVEAEMLDAHQLHEAEPNLRPDLPGALRVPGDSVVYSPCVAQWLVRRAVGRGASLLHSTAIGELTRGEITLSDGIRISAGAVVNAAGALAPRLVPGLPIRSRKGHLAITDRYPGYVSHQLVELGYLKSAHGHSSESVAFNVQPRATGQVLIGSSRQYGVEDRGVEPPFLGRMLRRALDYMPSLANLNIIRTWTGFRPATPDSLPIIGEWAPGLWIAAGHEGLGITTSLGTARLLTDLVTGVTPAISPAPYLPARFQSAHP